MRERRISIDARWLGRNELLKLVFSPAAEWRELSDWLLRVTAAVARMPYEGDDARQRVEFLAPVVVYPGEDELLALCQGALRVMTGEEEAKNY